MENNHDFEQYVKEAQILINRLRPTISGSQEYIEFLFGIGTQLKLIDETIKLRKEIELWNLTNMNPQPKRDLNWDSALAPDPNYLRRHPLSLNAAELLHKSQNGTTGDGTSKPGDSSVGTTSSIQKEKLSELSPLAQSIISNIGLKDKPENG